MIVEKEELSTGELMLLSNWLRALLVRELRPTRTHEPRQMVLINCAYYAGRAAGLAGSPQVQE